VNLPTVRGRKDEPWIMVDVKEIAVILFLPELRKEMDIEKTLFEPVPKPIMDSFLYYESKKSKSQ
jgi:ribosomal silencing factor RsfS